MMAEFSYLRLLLQAQRPQNNRASTQRVSLSTWLTLLPLN